MSIGDYQTKVDIYFLSMKNLVWFIYASKIIIANNSTVYFIN